MKISKFLEKYGIDVKKHVIYNMMNLREPSIDIKKILSDYKTLLDKKDGL